MSSIDLVENEAMAMVDQAIGADLLRPLVEAQSTRPPQPATSNGVVIGELVGMKDEGRTPLVIYSGQRGSDALTARSVVDLYGPHIGSKVVLMFEGGDSRRPIVMGVLREGDGWAVAEQPGQIEIDADGERLIIGAKEQIVLKCGKASITLTATGKVLIRGEYVSSQAAGVNRVKGGSVQLN